jgi:tetratricopeptide (TPR) repeat protein
VQRILGALATHLFTHAHSSLQSRPPAFEAYREFLAGSELFPGDMRGAIRHLSRAVEIDPEFTSARIRLAMVLLNARRADEGCAILEDLRVRRAELTEFERLWLDRALARYEGRSEDSLAALHSIRRLSPADWTTMYLVALEELRLNRPRRAVAALEELHAADLPDFVTRHGLFINSYRLLANAWHIVGDHESELAATQAGRARSPTDHNLMVVEAKARAALGDSQGLEAVIAEAESTPMSLTPANLLVEAAASARAHDRPEFSRTLAEQAIALLRRSAGAAAERLLLAEASVLLGELDRAQTIFEALVAELTPPRNYLDLIARGWLGSVAARRGDLVTAQSIDRELAGIDDPYLYGWPVYYRASVAAWLGHRDEAIALLRTARAAGWSASFALHDGERVLFEPLEGMAEYEEMLHPVE